MTETKIISGKAKAEEVLGVVKAASEKLIAETGVTPGIAVVIVGEDPASQVYVRSKGKRAEECGFVSRTHRLDENVGEAELLALVQSLNDDADIHGILVQLPLPKHINEDKIIETILPEKDVDGFHPINIGLLSTGNRTRALIPCTPAGSLLLAKEALGSNLSGLNAVVIGRSNIVGKPMAALLLQESCTVTIAHSRTKNIEALAKTADILVAAVGRPKMINASWIKPGATVIDVGINRIPAPEKGEGKMRLVGDVDYDDVIGTAGAITPVPGGVGLMTIAMLMSNTVTAAARAAGRSDLEPEFKL
ncbi:MAG: bifunctional methylenetetrahydrofolate dehydrogenase/methenyltetrahydrofolate cyclohydrolase [Hyphomicrobiales bacterium]|nr:MAG: bifunctional methylenetetrahydrofolate dehydrogenase/methenyltetrahydrofolate cyclohydrolase [Hyphomicrobiales bacterium]